MPTANRSEQNGELVTARRFGVELELTALRIADFAADMTRYGITLSRQEVGGSTRGTPTSWILKRDGSVQGQGLELVSPPLSGAKGLAEIRFVIELVKANGGAVDGSCGFHVHHSAHDLTDTHLKNLLTVWYKYQDMLYMVADPTRAGNRYCNKLSEEEFNGLHATTRGFGAALRSTDRYRGLNFAALAVHNTVEFRLLEGTLNAGKITAWVALTQRIVRVARWATTAIEPTKVGKQFQLLGAVTKMLSRNGHTASEDEEQAFNLLSSYYHKNARALGVSTRSRQRAQMGA